MIMSDCCLMNIAHVTNLSNNFVVFSYLNISGYLAKIGESVFY